MAETEEFAMPIMSGLKRQGVLTIPVTPAMRDKAKDNHGQTLERLRERGGLGWVELYCIVYNKRPKDVVHNTASQEQVRAHFVDGLHWNWEPTHAR